MFSKKKKNKQKMIQESKEEKEEIKISKLYKKPKLCSFDLKESDRILLNEAGFEVYKGSFGPVVKIQNDYNKGHNCLLNCDIPDNLHEFDILIFDLISKNVIDYKPEDHVKQNVTTKQDLYLYCGYPKNIFDPRPYSSSLITKQLSDMIEKDSMVIVFANTFNEIEYEISNNDSGRYANIIDTVKKNNYGFLPNGIRYSGNKSGKNIKVSNKATIFHSSLNKYLDMMDYRIVFYHPKDWVNGKSVESKSFVPLLYNDSDEIVGYAEVNNKQWVFVFPEIEQKGPFIKELLTEVLPSVTPQIFPEHTTASWTKAPDYFLPNHKELIEEKNSIMKRHERELNDINEEINTNTEKFIFLHKILTASGDELVENIIKYLSWLGFQKITDMDKEQENKKEEDIQVELENGLLIIEAKGIGGTSKDDECAQISKIRSRRCEERGKFDVFGLYIVNHQRHLPPLERDNPPFTDDQVRDANLNKRGLCTTWDLFNLYFNISAGIISKESAQKNLIENGYIEFKPSNLIKIGTVSEIYQNGEIAIINEIQTKISIGTIIFKKTLYKYEKMEITNIQSNGIDTQEMNSGEAGIKIDGKLKLHDDLYILKSP
ncbi:MAG: hypothetical protein GX272_00115 [Epulopiscium sp.]|nr:hypothetical protein [Candidatus Epulonipiscium sp.]